VLTLLVAGALVDGVALRALGLEDLLAGSWVPRGRLRERRHRCRGRSRGGPELELGFPLAVGGGGGGDGRPCCSVAFSRLNETMQCRHTPRTRNASGTRHVKLP